MNRVAVLGPAASGKKTLARTILKCCKPDVIVSSESAPSGGPITLDLDTKYYNATISFNILPGVAFGAPTPAVVEESDAIIVVLPAAVEVSALDALVPWGDALSSVSSTALLVLSKTDTITDEAAYATFREAATDWALDHGFELVEANCTDHVAGGQSTREKFGVPRVLEALESTMWPNLQRKPRDAPSHAVAHTIPSVTQPVMLQATGGSADPAATQRELEAGGAAVIDLIDAPATLSAAPAFDTPPELQEDAAYERMIDGLDTIMQQIQSARAQSSSARDEDRRENAAMLALRLAAMLGLDGSDEGSGSDSEAEQ